MSQDRTRCPDCDGGFHVPKSDRRQFPLRWRRALAVAPLPCGRNKDSTTRPEPESVKTLYETLTDDQKEICFAWDHIDPKRGLRHPGGEQLEHYRAID